MSSTIRNNLLNEQGYTPYCGKYNCKEGMPRTKFDPVKKQFTCKCGWVSQFPKSFIEEYMQKWNLSTIKKNFHFS